MATIAELEEHLANLSQENTRLHRELTRERERLDQWEQSLLIRHHLAVGTFDAASHQGVSTLPLRNSAL